MLFKFYVVMDSEFGTECGKMSLGLRRYLWPN